jgi:AraC-like DNA-binding protein
MVINNNKLSIKQIEEQENYHMSFKEIADELCLSENEVKKIYNTAIRKLKHPVNFKYFKDLIGEKTIEETLSKYGDEILK